MQSISPGVVETEFTPRLYSNNPDKAATSYTKFKVKIKYYQNNKFLFKQSILFHLSLLLQPLDAIDVANSVTYVLSAPPHVQVGDFSLPCRHFSAFYTDLSHVSNLYSFTDDISVVYP